MVGTFFINGLYVAGAPVVDDRRARLGRVVGRDRADALRAQHDGAALPSIIRSYKARGYRLVGVGRLLRR